MNAVLNVVLPVFGIILAGYLAGRWRLLGTHGSEALNGFVYYAALPGLFVGAMAKAPLGQILNGPFLLAYLGAMIAVGLPLFLLAGRFLGDGLAPRSVQNMAAIFSNTGYMGIPLLVTAFGQGAALPAIIATIINGAVVMGLYIMLIEYDRSRGAHRLAAAIDALRGLFKSPLVIAALIGLALSALGLPLPRPLAAFCDILGAAAPPAALFAMGLFMVGKSFEGDGREIAIISALKLIAHPAATWAMILLVGPLDPLWRDCLLVLGGLPTGSLVFVLSARYGVYTRRASGIILASTLASIATLSALIAYLGAR